VEEIRSMKTALTVTAAAAAITAGVLAVQSPASAAQPLPVTLSADGNGTAAFDAAGDIALTLGSTGTYAQAAVAKTALGTAPAVPPSFTTSAYGAGSPRWVIELANGQYLFGYPAQLGAGATADFTGPQWQPSGSATYETYAKALADAGDPLGNVQVTDAYIVMDADQPPSTDTISGMQYDGMTAAPPVAKPQVPVLSHGRMTSHTTSRAVAAWTSVPPAGSYRVTLRFPGSENGRTAVVTKPQASYSGLPAGHTGSVLVQALGHGQAAGKAGVIDITTRSAA